MQSWVPHVSCFIVPRQIVLLGDPSRRSADACESYGALIKKRIKHMTCRRRTIDADGNPYSKQTRGKNAWKQTFTRGYLEQVFRRGCVSEALLHGPENLPYLGRTEHALLDKGLKKENTKSEREVPPTVRATCALESE